MPLRVADAVFWIACACCVIAQVAIVRSVIISPASRQSAEGGAMSSPSKSAASRRTVELAWAILPGVALAVVLFYTWSAMHGVRTVVITGAAV